MTHEEVNKKRHTYAIDRREEQQIVVSSFKDMAQILVSAVALDELHDGVRSAQGVSCLQCFAS